MGSSTARVRYAASSANSRATTRNPQPARTAAVCVPALSASTTKTPAMITSVTPRAPNSALLRLARRSDSTRPAVRPAILELLLGPDSGAYVALIDVRLDRLVQGLREDMRSDPLAAVGNRSGLHQFAH